MRNLASKNRHNALTIITVIGLMIIFSFYFFIYIPKQEDNLHKENFRVLSKITVNMDGRIHEYKQYINDRARYLLLLSTYSGFLPDMEKSVNPFHNGFTDAMSQYYLEKLPEVELLYFCPDSLVPSDASLREKLDSKPYDYFLLERDTCSYDGIKYEYGFTLNMESVLPLLSGDAFRDYFLVRDNKIISGPHAGLLADTADSLLSTLNGIKTGKIFSQTVSGIPMKLFAQPFRLGTNENFILCGMIDTDTYHQKTRNLSGNIILFILLGLFLIALGLPFVKFLLMSRNERLNIPDALFAGITVILGTAVLVLVLLDVYTYSIPAKEARNKQLKDLSSDISSNFMNEINSAYRQLEIYDSLIGKPGYGKIQTNIVCLNDSPSAELSDNFRTFYTDPKKKNDVAKFPVRPSVYTNFKQVFWTDSTGEQLFKWSTASTSTPLIQVDERNYFQRVMHNQLWTLHRKDSPGFILEGLYSWTTGENVAVIAKRSRQKVTYRNDWFEDSTTTTRTSLAAITTVLYSVMDPILPLSSGFCIIDENGKVIFHSDKSRNLTENFLDECSEKDEIQSAIYSRRPAFFSSGYRNGKYNMYVNPIDQLPLYIVTFQDSDYSGTSNAETLSLSVLLVLVFFVFVCFLVFVLKLITSRQSILSSRKFTFEWLWPVKEKQAAYQQIIFFLIPVFILLLIFLHYAGPVETILMFFASSILMFVFVYLKIEQYTENGERKSRKEFLNRSNRIILISGFVLLLTVNVSALNRIDNFAGFILYEISVAAIGFSLFVFRLPDFRRMGYRNCYLLFQLGMLTMISIVPTFAFFRIAFEKEAEIRIRHGQLELAQELNRKSDELNKAYRISGKDALHTDVYSRAFYDTKILPEGEKGYKQKASSMSDEEDLFGEISVDLTPSYNDIVTKEQYLANSAADASWKWKKSGAHAVILDYHDLQRSKNEAVDALAISSQIPAYKLPSPFGAEGFGLRGILFWLGIGISIMVLYFFIRFVVRTIFTVDFFRDNEYRKTDISMLNNYFDSANIFLIGAPFSGKTKWLNEHYSKGNKKQIINLILLKTADDVKSQLAKCREADTILIDHFEYGFKDFVFARRRLRFFEQLLEMENKRIMIVSTIHPLKFIEEYPQPTEKPDDKNSNEIIGKAVDDLDKWIKLLGGFHKFYFKVSGAVEESVHKKQKTEDIIAKECRGSFFLREKEDFIREACKTEKSEHRLSEEEIILRIQSLAYVYYNSLWLSLSEEEQYIIYDIAQDGLVNLKNRQVLTMLLNKGIMVYDSRFRLMNESFRNFVLTEVSSGEALALERKVKETGTWNYFKTPMVIILITLALFIFITQQETFNTIIAFITTFAAGIPIIFRLLGMLTSMKATKIASAG